MKAKILFTAILMSCYTIAVSQIINVPADQPTIQAGINAANDGDTVLVAPETYYENINFSGKAITVASHFLMDGDTIVAPGTLVAQWLFNGDGTDASGNGHHGTASAGHPNWGGGMPELAEDRHGNADYCYKFVDGANFVVPNSPAFIPPELTISVWMKLYETWPHSYFISNDIWHTWKFQVQDANKPFFTVHILKDDGSGDDYWIDRDSNTGILELDTWHHVVLTYTSGTMIFYINGVKVVEWDGLQTGTIIPPHEGIDLCIGQALATDDFDDDLHEWQPWLGYFKGWLDDMRIYNVVLTDAQVSTLYLYEKDNTITDPNYISNTIIDGSQPAHRDSTSVVYFISGEDTTSIIKGFTIQGGSGTPSSWGDGISGGGIFCAESGPKIEYNHIINNHCEGGGTFVSGGGIFSDTCSDRITVIRQNLISENSCTSYESSTSAVTGGGISALNDAIITDNIIKNNSIFHGAFKQAIGGGVECSFNKSIIINNIIKGNIAENTGSVWNPWGGGIYGENSRDGTLISENVIENNTAIGSTTDGGGIGLWANAGIITIDKNLIRSNEAGNGGGIALGVSFGVEIMNNIIQGNDAGARAGGIYIEDGSSDRNSGIRSFGIEFDERAYTKKSRSIIPVIVNNTIIENTTAGEGGGIAFINPYQSFLAFNNIIFNNTAVSEGNEIYLSSLANAYLYHNDLNTDDIGGSGSWEGSGNIFTDPQFVVGDTLYHLSPSSGCINEGIETLYINSETFVCPPFDYDGDPRPDTCSFIPDIGADEVICVEANTYNITFKVDMTDADPFNPETDDVYLSGSMVGWPMPGTFPDLMMIPTEPDSMIYTKDLLLYKDDYMYKYFRVINNTPSWDHGEWQGGPNREFTVDTTMTLDDVWALIVGEFDDIYTFTYNIYPNPVNELLYLSDIADVNRVEIYDITGKLVKIVEPESTEQIHIDVSGLQNGMYIMYVHHEKGVHSTKFIKE